MSLFYGGKFSECFGIQDAILSNTGNMEGGLVDKTGIFVTHQVKLNPH